MILPKIRDKRFTTLRRRGTLTDEDHHLLALWAAQCANHVLHFFEKARPDDGRPGKAIALTDAWVRGETTMTEARIAAFHANAAAREVQGAAKYAALSAGQAVAVAHVAAHYLGAAAYAIRAVLAASEEDSKDEMGGKEWTWQIKQLPLKLKELALEDQKHRNGICWNVFYV